MQIVLFGLELPGVWSEHCYPETSPRCPWGVLTHLQQSLIHLPDCIPSWILSMTWLSFPLHFYQAIFSPCGIEFHGLWQMPGIARPPFTEQFHHLPNALKLCLCLQPISLLLAISDLFCFYRFWFFSMESSSI